MAVSVLLVIAIGLFVGLVVIPHLHFLVVAIAHIFHPHVFGIVAGAIAVMVLLLALVGVFWAAPARVMAPAPAIGMRADPGRVVMEVRDAPTAISAPHVAIAESSPTWAKLAALPLILLGIMVVVALIANPHFRALLQSRPAAIILAASPVAVIFVVLLSYRAARMDSESAQRAAFEQAGRHAQPPTAYPITTTIPPAPAKAEKPADSGKPPALTAEKSEADAASLPDWVRRESNLTDNPYYIVVNSGDFTDPFGREEMLNAQTVNAADKFIKGVMHRPAAVAEAVKFSPEYLRSSYFDAQYPAAGTTAAGETTYVRLKFDDRFRDEVDRRWRQFASDDHLQKLSGYSAVGLALLGVVYIYLRATSPKHAS